MNITPNPKSAVSVFAALHKLSKPQRRTLMLARYHEHRHSYLPAGYYVDADRRILRNLAAAGIIRDYLNSHQRLTPFGLAIHKRLMEIST